MQRVFLRFVQDELERTSGIRGCRCWRGSICKTKEADSLDKLVLAFLRRAEEGILARMLVESTILLASSRSNPAQLLRDAALLYKVDTDAIALKVKQEFSAKEKAKNVSKAEPKAVPKSKAA